MAKKPELLEVKVNYFELELEPYKANEGVFSSTILRELLSSVQEQLKTKKAIYIDKFASREGNNKRVMCIYSLKPMPKEQIICGKMALFRDKVPALMSEDLNVSDISLLDKSLIEITHFYVDYKGKKPIISFEYNYHGCRISDFEYYVRQLAKEWQRAKKCQAKVFISGEIKTILDTLKNIVSIDLKVKQEKARVLRDADRNFYSAYDSVNNNFPAEDVRIIANFSRKRKNIKALELGRNLMNHFIKKPEDLQQLELFKLEYESDTGIHPYDFIKEKEVDEFLVGQQTKGRPSSHALTTFALEALIERRKK